MKLEAGCGIATSEVPKAEKEAQPDSEPWWPQEARAKSKSGSGLETEDKLLRAESGPEAKAESLGAAPRSGSRPEDEALVFVVATEQEFEEVLAIFRDIYSGLDYLPSRYHSWLRDPNRTVVLAKRNGGVVRTEGRGPGEKEVKAHLGLWILGRRGSEPLSSSPSQIAEDIELALEPKSRACRPRGPGSEGGLRDL